MNSISIIYHFAFCISFLMGPRFLKRYYSGPLSFYSSKFYFSSQYNFFCLSPGFPRCDTQIRIPLFCTSGVFYLIFSTLQILSLNICRYVRISVNLGFECASFVSRMLNSFSIKTFCPASSDWKPSDQGFLRARRSILGLGALFSFIRTGSVFGWNRFSFLFHFNLAYKNTKEFPLHSLTLKSL